MGDLGDLTIKPPPIEGMIAVNEILLFPDSKLSQSVD